MTDPSHRQTRTVVVWGDSIAASGWPQLMEHTFNSCCNTGVSIRVVNSGKGGNPAARAVREFNASVLAHRPAVVFIQFGFNDQRFDGSRGTRPISTPTEFRSHLAEMISAVWKPARK
jgi:lysophospholipase L1-like esterase